MEDNTTNLNNVSVTEPDNNSNELTGEQLGMGRIEENRNRRLNEYGEACKKFLEKAKDIQANYKESENNQKTNTLEKDADANER